MSFAQNTQQYPDFVRAWQQTEALINPASFSLDSTYAKAFALQKFRTGPLKKIGFKTLVSELNVTKDYGTHSFRFIAYSETEGPYISRPRWYGTYAYHMKLANDLNVGLGLTYGYVQNKYDVPTALNGNEGVSDGAIGLKVKYKQLEFGASSLQLFNNSILTGKEVSLELARYYNFTSLYRIDLNNKFGLIPSIYYRYLPQGKDDVLITLEMDYNNQFAIGVIEEVIKGVSFYIKSTNLSESIPISLLMLYRTSLFSNTPTQFNHYEIGLGYQFNR